MARKRAEIGETYVARKVFACGEGHFLAPGFTHWEEGEACPFADHDPESSNEDVHLYYRTLLVPLQSSDDPPIDLWEKLCRPENANKWGKLPVVP